MPHHKSCKKRMRTGAEERTRNRAYRSELRGLMRQVRQADTQKAAQEHMLKVGSLLDRLARKRVIKKNNAANHKSRLQRFVNKLPLGA